MIYESARLRLASVDGIATLSLDAPGGNALSLALLRDLDRALSAAAEHPALDVLLIRSEVPDCFLTGASTQEYERLSTAEVRRHYAAAGRRVLERLCELSDRVRTVAYIDGACLNEGLELALACDYRLAVARPETRIGCDYLEQGRLPCLGATQRLPQLVGLRSGLDMLLNSRTVTARAAKTLGMVDHAFGPRPAKTELWWFLADLQDRMRKPIPQRGWLARLREHRLLCNSTIFPTFESRDNNAQGRAILTAVRRGWCNRPADGFAEETRAFVRDGLHPESAAQRERCREREVLAARWADVTPPRHIGIETLDAVGTTIAGLALRGGASLSVRDFAGPAMLEQTVRQAAAEGWFNVIEAEQKLKSIDDRFDDAELIVLTGSPEKQQRELAQYDAQFGPNVILAATGSSPRVEGLLYPERVAGIRLSDRSCELTATPLTDDLTLARLFRWLERCGLRPQLATSVRGELVFAA